MNNKSSNNAWKAPEATKEFVVTINPDGSVTGPPDCPQETMDQIRDMVAGKLNQGEHLIPCAFDDAPVPPLTDAEIVDFLSFKDEMMSPMLVLDRNQSAQFLEVETDHDRLLKEIDRFRDLMSELQAAVPAPKTKSIWTRLLTWVSDNTFSLFEMWCLFLIFGFTSHFGFPVGFLMTVGLMVPVMALNSFLRFVAGRAS